jgi:hypothetical protein
MSKGPLPMSKGSLPTNKGPLPTKSGPLSMNEGPFLKHQGDFIIRPAALSDQRSTFLEDIRRVRQPKGNRSTTTNETEIVMATTNKSTHRSLVTLSLPKSQGVSKSADYVERVCAIDARP